MAKNQNKLFGEVMKLLLLGHLTSILGLVRDGQGIFGHTSWQVHGLSELVWLLRWNLSSICTDSYGCVGHSAYERFYI